MYTEWHVDKYKITFELITNWTNEILQHVVVSSGLSRPGIIDARARYRAAARRLRNAALMNPIFTHINPVHIKVKVMQFYRPQGFQEFEVPRFRNNQHMEVASLSALRTGRLQPPRKYSWYSFLLEAESNLGPWCGQKDYVNEKLVTPSGIEPATCRLVAQCLNQLHHRVPHPVSTQTILFSPSFFSTGHLINTSHKLTMYYLCYMPHPSHSPQYDQPNNIW